jgi:hypothetical protein
MSTFFTTAELKQIKNLLVVTFLHQRDVCSAKKSGRKGQGTLTKGESLVLLTSSLR